jgi:histone acetyltransferase
VQESGWSWQDHEELIKTKEVSFLLECQNLLELLKKHPSSWPFRDPVSLEDVPDYVLVVKEPIDLKTIEKKLASSEYADKQAFVEDILKVCRNSRLYNQPETVYFKCANELEDYAKPHIDALFRGELLLDKRASSKAKAKSTDKKMKKSANCEP